jgi:hypothetical protein
MRSFDEVEEEQSVKQDMVRILMDSLCYEFGGVEGSFQPSTIKKTKWKSMKKMSKALKKW